LDEIRHLEHTNGIYTSISVSTNNIWVWMESDDLFNQRNRLATILRQARF